MFSGKVQLPPPRFRRGSIEQPGWKRKLLSRAQDDPDWWMSNVLGASLWSKQQDIAQALVHHDRVAVPACFGAGKTYLAARLALWFVYNFRPAKVITTAPTNRQVKDLLWSELRTAHQQARFPLGGDPLILRLDVDTDQYAIGFSTKDYNIDYFTGYHAPHQMVVFDQASGLPKIFWDAAEGLMTGAHSRWLAIGNTAIPDGEFANICMPGRSTKYGDWKVIPIDAAETPNVIAGEDLYPGLIAHDWVDKKKQQWGEDDPLYQIFVLANFVASEQMVVVPMRLQKLLLKNAAEMHPTDIEIGLDVARQGTDSTVWVARSGSRTLWVKRHTGNDLMQVVGETVEFKKFLEKKYSTRKVKRVVQAIKVDVIGVGGGVYDRLAELDHPVVPVNNAESALDTERYINVRAEMAWMFREDIDAGIISLDGIQADDPEDLEKLDADIRAIKYKISSSGKIQIWDKDAIRKDLGRSPDYWDALVMAFESPGGSPSIGVVGSDPDGNIRVEEHEDPDKKELDRLFDPGALPEDDEYDEYY